jgi:NADH-quinone oxidoreductase subunit N
MSPQDYIILLPLMILGLTSVLSLMVSAFIRRAGAAFAVAIIGMALSLASLAYVWPLAPRTASGFLTLDRFSLFTVGLIVAASLVSAISAIGALTGREDERGEFFFFLVLSALGGAVLAASSNFAAFFLGLELLSVPLFTLIAYRREHTPGAEAGIKYLILAGVSSAFLLFGMALSYSALGTMDLSQVAQGAASGSGGLLLPAGLGFIAVGIGFKLAVVPFHFWTPDVYDGASSPVAGYIATASKGAMAVLLVRLFAPTGIVALGTFGWVFAVISAITMFTGNFLALREDNVKRILAYSSIAHLGYLLIAFVASGSRAITATAFFLAAYFASTLGAFSSISAISSRQREADRIQDYRGLASRRPWLAGCFTASLLSLAGLPLTAGFMGKFILFSAGEASYLWVLAVLLAVNSTISLFYYLRVVSMMYRTAEEPEEVHAEGAPAGRGVAGPGGAVVAAVGSRGGALSVPFFTGLALALMTLAIVVLGVYPTPLLQLIELLTSG